MLDIGWKDSVFWPIIVEGRSMETNWPKVDREAARALHRLASLVSLEWVEPLQVRIGPQSGAFPPQFPDDWMAPNDSRFGPNPQVGLRDEQPLPEWLQGAWSILETNDPKGDAAAALSLWHEGVLLQPEHPSFALVAFVASVEQMGKLLEPRKRGYAPRFWNALRGAVSQSEFAALKMIDVYKLRSEIAHGSRVHGLETIYGAVVPPPALATVAPDSISLCSPNRSADGEGGKSAADREAGNVVVRLKGQPIPDQGLPGSSSTAS